MNTPVIHVARSGQVLGQFGPEQVAAGLANGTFLSTDHCWAAGYATWITLGQWSNQRAKASAAAQPRQPSSPVKKPAPAPAQPSRVAPRKPVAPSPARPAGVAAPVSTLGAPAQATTITINLPIGLIGGLLVIAGSLTPFIRIGPGSLSLIGNGDAPRGWLFIALGALAIVFARSNSLIALRCVTAATMAVALELAYHLSGVFRNMSPRRGADGIDALASAMARSMIGIEFGAYILGAGCICLLIAAFKSDNK